MSLSSDFHDQAVAQKAIAAELKSMTTVGKQVVEQLTLLNATLVKLFTCLCPDASGGMTPEEVDEVTARLQGADQRLKDAAQ